MKLIKEIKITPEKNNKNFLTIEVAKKCKIKPSDIIKMEIVKQGIDARKKPNVFYIYNVAIDVKKSQVKKLEKFEDVEVDKTGLYYKNIFETKNTADNNFTEMKSDSKISNYYAPPVVVGFGPSGMFCALTLALAGLKPIVLEQGKKADERKIDVEKFWKERKLNPHSNVQFGEGGAGTFSDGKLNTTLNNEYCKKVINELILNGAPEEIYYKNKAHIGTDNLIKIVTKIREKIENLGGKVVFNAKFKDFSLKNNKINQICYMNLLNNKIEKINTNNLILALGHSALETFEMLNGRCVKMHTKPFAMGVRIEHKQSLINLSQYGKEFDENLPSADYKLVEHLKNGRSVFTFCMCPGGEVVASSSEEFGIVTNGMSEFARKKEFANSALLVNVLPKDYFVGNVLDGFYFQRKYERLAFEIAGKNYNAPVEDLGNFLYGQKAENINSCSYKPNVTVCKISKCLPNFVVESLKEGILLFDKKIKGFANKENLIIAPETRSSCPIQFERDAEYVCTYDGLYACGEGAGFAGGIISSAVDGIKCAEKIIFNYQKKKIK